MKGYAVFKAKKLLKITLEHDGTRIDSVKIHGDFFFYPEDKIGELEKTLEGAPLEKEVLLQKIQLFLQTADAFGFDASDLAQAILQAGGKA